MGKGGNCILWGLGPSLLSSQDLRLNLTSPLENGSAGKQELLVEAERGLLHAGCQLSPVLSCPVSPVRKSQAAWQMPILQYSPEGVGGVQEIPHLHEHGDRGTNPTDQLLLLPCAWLVSTVHQTQRSCLSTAREVTKLQSKCGSFKLSE